MEEKRYKKGFTLIEVLTSIFIIALLSTLTLGIYRQTNKQYALFRSANKLAQDIRRAQQMAMTTKECCGGTIPQGGYGISINALATSYKLYADNNSSEMYEIGDSIVETINFESGVYVQAINPNPFSINYKPPDPTTKINGGTVINVGTITLALQSDPSKTKIITVNKFGLIQVN